MLFRSRLLGQAGHQEIILTGINLGTYYYQGKTIIEVIEALEQIELIKRIRISSIEPTTIPIELIHKMAKQTKLCRYLHVPLQSGHNNILKRMQRKYTIEEFSDFVQTVFALVPDICIGTDVIVGFPGEREEEFNTTYALLRELPIHYFHVFSYSKRTLAKSRTYTDVVPVSVFQKRSEILHELSHRKRLVFYESQIGKTYDVLFENKKNDLWIGLTDNYIRVGVKSTKNFANQFYETNLKAIRGPYVLGEIALSTVPSQSFCY